MRLRTRVLSFMLAGSMMLSATPVSAFAGTPVLGGGTVSPTALSETNSTGTLAFDQYGYPYDSTKGNEYETNHHTTAVVSSDGSWAYQKFTNSQGDVYILVLTENFDQALTGQTINCQVISKAPTLTGGTYNGIVQLGSTDQRSDASGCTFNAPIAVLAAGTTLTGCTANSSVQCAAADITLTGCTINRKSDDSTVLWLSKYDDSNTAAGCSMTLNNCNVSCGVLVSTDGKATINGGTYNIPGEKMGIVATGAVCITGGEFTTQIVASTNGSITIENGTFNLGERKFISAAGGDITIEDGTFDSYLQAQTGSLTIKGGTFTGLVGALNGNITIEDGTFTGQAVALSANAPKYTGVLNITGGVFAKEPQGATGSLYKLSAEGASFNGMASPVYVANQTAVPQIEITYSANPAHKVIAWRFDIDNSIKQHGNSDATDPRAAVLLAQANYTHSADNRTIRFDCVPSIKYNGYTMGALNADTVFSPVLDVLPSELTFHAATENGPASVELGADMPADRIDISCFYTNVATNEVSEEYPTEAGTYQISVILKAKGLSDELKYNIYQNRVEWNGAYHQLSYANESTGNTLTSLTSENWRFQISFDIDNSIKQHGNSDATDPRAAVLLAQANYTHSADNRTIRFDCVPSIKYNGYTMGALNADTVFSPVLDVLPSELTFHAATENGPASVELGADMPADRIDISCFYTNVATNEVSEEYPTEAGTYQISVILKAKGLSDELKYNIYQNRVEWNGAYHQLSYANESTGNTLTSLTSENWRFQISTNTVTLTVDENGAPVIPENAKGVRYENNTLTIDEHTTARFAQGSTVKCDIVNNGTLDGGLFTGTVTGSGSIARGLFLHDPKTSLPTMMLSVPENASLNGITAPDATGLTTLYAINTLDGEDNTLLFIGDYIGTDPHDFYGWDLVYSLDGEEKNSDVEKNYIGKTHFEQPMYGPIPDGQNGVKCIFLPVLEMNASDLTITADKTESKIDGAVIASVKYVDASDPNAAPSSVYPTKAGSYKAIVTLTCPGDSTYSKARVARIGNLCYYVPETLEVEVTVELPTVPPTDGDGNVTFEGTDEVKGDGWTAKKDDEGKTTVEITDGKNLGNTTLNCNKITIGSAETSTTVSNITTNADVTVASGSAIEGGTFSGNVSGTGTIEGGTFSGNVGSEVKINGGTFTGNVDSTKINGGVFAGEIPTTVESTKVTATGGASINNIQKNEGTNQETAVQVVGEQQLSLAYTPDEGRTFYGWQKDADIIAKGDATPTVSADSTDSVYTPVVEMNLSDIQDGESNIEGTAVTSIRYYKVDANGLPEGDGYDDAPVDDGTFEDGRYVQYIALKLTDEPTENTIALYADEDVPSRVVVKNGIGYYVPEFLATGEEVRIGDIPDDTATGSGDSGAGGAAVAVIGGAAIGGAAYLIGTQVYLTSVLPEGASIPTNRQQLADLLWTAAGKPQPASTALFTDISAEAADSQKAARWCVEQGLLKDTGSTFKPDKHTFRPQVIKAWNDLQAKLNPQK